MGFRLSDLNLTLAYYKGQFGSWNGVLYDYVLRTNDDLEVLIFAHMYIDKVRLLANFHPNRQRHWSSFQNQRFEMEYIGLNIKPRVNCTALYCHILFQLYSVWWILLACQCRGQRITSQKCFDDGGIEFRTVRTSSPVCNH